LGIKNERKRDTLVVHLAGELDHHHAEEIREELDSLLNDPSIRHLIFDLENLHFMDSSGIGVFLGRYKRIMKRGGTVCIVRVNPQIHKILEMSGLYKILKVYADVRAALEALRGVS